MSESFPRRSLLKIIGTTLASGALYRMGLGFEANPKAVDALELLGQKNGERITPFSFVQLSDTHVGFIGPPNPLGTKAFERAVEEVNALPEQPDLVLFTGDLTHDSETEGESAARMKLFKEIASGLKVKNQKCVAGEHDAGLDGGALYRDHFGPSHYSFDHRGVHFIALDNVSLGKPVVGMEQLGWLKQDLGRFRKSTPIVVFTHRPLFDLKPEWEWYTGDGDEVMNALAPYDNVTILYGHIHRVHSREIGHSRHFAARSLTFAFPDPAFTEEKKPLPFDKNIPFQNLGLRRIDLAAQQPTGVPKITDVELSTREFSGTVGISQLIKEGEY